MIFKNKSDKEVNLLYDSIHENTLGKVDNKKLIAWSFLIGLGILTLYCKYYNL